MTLTYKDRPTTNANYLYRSLGSFWTQVFQDKGVIKGYTKSQAEEIIQRYIDLVETVRNFSIKDTPILHTEKWKPIQLLKSNLNLAPFVFEPDRAVFGSQPESEAYYQNIVFKFGFKKEPNQNIYQYFIGKEFKTVSFIADRVLAPTKLYLHGSDYVLHDGVLVFNKDIFNDTQLEKYDVIGDDGVPVTFVDQDGVTQQEQSAVIWLYNTEIDVDYLFTNFGYIFDFRLENPDTYRGVLESLFGIIVDGPTVGDIKKLCAIALSTPFILNAIETVETVFSDAAYQYVVTDKECYKVELTSELISLPIGKVLHAGDILTKDVEYYDNGSSANGWWKRTGLIGSRLAFSKNLFLGNYANQLSFSTELELISLDSNGNVVFPVLGHPDDVKRFNQFLNNSSVRKSTLTTHFGLVNPGDTTPFTPLDFIMDNFLKLNVAFIKVRFTSAQEMASFLQFIPLVRDNLPPYIYLIIKLDLALPADTFNSLNGELVKIDSGTVDGNSDPVYWYLNADASDADGFIEPVNGYKDVKTRLFEIGRAITPQPYEIVAPSSVVTTEATTEGRRMTIKEGAVLRTIPANATTAEYNKLLLLDFS